MGCDLGVDVHGFLLELDAQFDDTPDRIADFYEPFGSA
jgi:hypothetical protein